MFPDLPKACQLFYIFIKSQVYIIFVYDKKNDETVLIQVLRKLCNRKMEEQKKEKSEGRRFMQLVV